MNDGKRALSQLERTTKCGCTSSSTCNISAALQSVHHDTLAVPESISGTFTGPFSSGSRLHPSIAHTLSPYHEDFPMLDHALQTLRKQRMDEYKQAVYIAPMAKSNLQASDDNLFSLMENVKKFLASNGQVMLVLGDSGAGKSTFNQYLEYQLWMNYRTGDRIPLFINLPGLERPKKELVAEQLRTFSFSDELIRELKLHRRFILICDGYDESQLNSNLHTTNLLNQPGQWDTKLLITCRTQYLGSDYRNRFVPKATSQYYRSADDLFHEAVIVPFSKGQIEDYVERYVPLEPRTWVKEDYMDKLTTIPNLMDLVKNPFLLTLCLEALPSVVEGKTNLSRLWVTRTHIYDNFVEHWMAVNKRRLQEQKLGGDYLKALEELLDDGFEKAVIKFQQGLATAIFQEQEGRPVVDYTPRRDKNSWKAAFFSSEPETTLLRTASLLSRVANQFRFVHRSVLEYFYSCAICSPSSNIVGIAPQCRVDFGTVLLSFDDHPLSHRNLVVEPSIVQFLSERVHSNPEFERHLHDLLERSKTDDQAGRAAANAITILVKAGVRFNGADLRGIRIPGADLTAGQFDIAQLQGADLTSVNLTKSWIRQANFTRTQMERVQFGELAYLKMSEQVISCAFSPDGKTFIGSLASGNIIVYDTATWTKVCSFEGDQGGITSIAFSPSSHQLVTACRDSTLRLWDYETGRCELVLEGHSGSGMSVAFSPSGKQIATASLFKSMKLWNFQSHPASFVAIKDNSMMTSVAYSPDGLYIASGGVDGAVRIFDTETGSLKLVLKSESQSVICIAFSPDGQCIVFGHVNGELQVRNTTDGKSGSNWKGHATDVTSAVFSPNGQWIASSSQDSTVKLWSAQTRALMSVFSGHSGVITSVAFSPDNALLASGSWDSTVRIWQINSTRKVFEFSDPTDSASSLEYSPNGQFLLTGTWAGRVYQYDAASGAPDLALLKGQSLVKCVAYSPDGLRFAVVDNSNEVKIWRMQTGQVDFILIGHPEEVTTVAFSLCGSRIATGSRDMTVRLWDSRSGAPGRVLSGHIKSISSISISPSEDRIFSGSGDGTIRVWDMNTGESRVIVSPDHDALAEVWDFFIYSYGLGDVEEFIVDFKYSRSCNQIATIHGDENVRLWSEDAGVFQHSLKHDTEVSCFAISSCGQWIACGSGDSVWLWNFVVEDGIQQWKCISKTPDFSFRYVRNIAWRPDNLEFAIGYDDSSIRVWRLQTGSNALSIQLVWSIGPAPLVVAGAVIIDTVGLSDVNRRLLLQRGAIDGSLLKEV